MAKGFGKRQSTLVRKSDRNKAKNLYQKGFSYFQSGDFTKAETSFRQLLASQDEHTDAWKMLGNVYYQQGNITDAIAAYEQIVKLQPNNADAWSNLGVLYVEQKQLDRAIAVFEQAIHLQPNCGDAHNNLGQLYLEQKQLAAAEKHLQQAIKCQPNLAIAHYNLGNLYKSTYQLDLAIAAFQQTIKIQPNYNKAYNNLGNAYLAKKEISLAIECYQQEINIQPNCADAYNNLGIAYYLRDDLAQAIDCYQQANRLQPNNASVYYHQIANAYKKRGDFTQAIDFYQKSLKLKPDYHLAHQDLLLFLHYSSEYSPKHIFDRHQEWYKLHCPQITPTNFPQANKPKLDKKLRIGYVSGDFFCHPVTYFLQPLLANHNHDNYEIFCYTNSFKTDAVTDKLKQVVDHWREIYHLDDEQAYQLIRQDEIDILVDLSGHTGDNRLLLFAKKPAPIQVTYLGYPNTTGLGTIDYRFTDNYADPQGETEHLHSEKLIRLPNSFLCYQPSASAPKVEPPPVITNGYITFGSFNNIAKVSDEVISYWATILQAVPNSRLLLKYGALSDTDTCDRIYNLFSQAGIESNRLDLRGWVKDANDHLATYNEVDIALDTYPYHGTTTTCEAMWMGVPIITLAGKTHVSRVGVSLLSSVGLNEFIAESSEEYISKAVYLANNHDKLAQLSENIRSRLELSPLTDGNAIAQSIELAYRQMWQDWCREKAEFRIQNSEAAGKNFTGFSEEIKLAQVYYQNGKLDEAIACLESIQQVEPNNIDIWYLLGNIYCKQREFEQAIYAYEQLILVQPENTSVLSNLGILYIYQGKPELAINAFDRAIEISPDYLTYNNLGQLYQDLGDLAKAEFYLQAALRLNPNYATSHYNLGNVYKRKDDIDRAIASFQQSLKIQPDYLDVYNNLGNTYLTKDELSLAWESYLQALKLENNLDDIDRDNSLEKILALSTKNASALNGLAIICIKQKKRLAAVKILNKVIELSPDYADAYNNLGQLHKELDRLAEAEQYFQQAIEIEPNFATAHYNLGNVYKSQDELTKAIAAYQQALAIEPNHQDVHNNLGNTYLASGDVYLALECYRQAAQTRSEHNLLFALHYSGEFSPEYIYQKHLAWGEKYEALISNKIKSHQNEPNPDRKLKIGYISTDFKAHSVSYFLESLLANCARQKFSITCYANNEKSDNTTARLQSFSDRWRSIYDLNDEQVAQLIRQDGIDILVDLGGHTSNNRLVIFAYKPAPIQVTYLGYPNTTGLKAIDYRFTDFYADPEGTTEHLHTEELYRLPQGFLCYQAPSDTPEMNALPAQMKGYITFGSFNNLSKISTEIISYWAKILHKVPQSRLLLKYKALQDSGTAERIYQLFASAGIERHRLDLRGWIQGTHSHLSLYYEVDIALDTYPYHGTTTTCEAMWMGVPVITLAGKSHVSRVGVSLLSSVGLNDFIANSAEEYINKAVNFANNLTKIAEIRTSLRFQIESSPLTDGKAIAQSIESAYRSMWQGWCREKAEGRGQKAEVETFHGTSLQKSEAREDRENGEGREENFSFSEKIKLAQGYYRDGKFSEAIAFYQQALQIQPDNIEIHLQLGNVYHQLGNLAKAIAFYQQAITIEPNYAHAHYNLAVVYGLQGNYPQQRECYQQLTKIEPQNSLNHLNLGKLWQKSGHFSKAIKSYQQAIDLQPNNADAHSSLGVAYNLRGHLTKAIECYQQAIKLKPDKAYSYYHHLGNVYKNRGDITQAINYYQKSLELKPDYSFAHRGLLLSLHYSSEYSPEEIFEQHQAWGKLQPNLANKTFANNLNPDRKLRIGYVSGDFKHHAVAHFVEPLLKNCARANFDIFCYANNIETDATTDRLKQLVTGWREIHHLDDKQVSELIQQDSIDILVDLAGHTMGDRLLVFNYKPAPIQVTYLGYPDTTGLETIDYRFTDAYADPQGQTEHLHTETLIRLQHGFLCYQPPTDTPPTSPSPVITNNYITFGSFNNVSKVSPEIIGYWADILKQVPNSRLLLKSGTLQDNDTRDRLDQLFAEAGIESNCLDLRGWIQETTNHLALYNEIDIALDTYPYNGTTTTCEALWMSVPVITLAGKTHVSRVGVSLLSTVGLKEFVADSPEAYISKAVYLAHNIAKLTELRANIRSQMDSSPLTDGKLSAQSIESAYRQMWQDWCQGKAEGRRQKSEAVRPNRRLTAYSQAHRRSQELQNSEAIKIQLNQAIKHQQLKEYTQAEQILRQVIQQYPDCSDAWHLLGSAYYQQAKLDQAIACYEKSREIEPNNTIAIDNLGVTCIAKGDVEKALSYWQEVMKLQPNHNSAWQNILFCLHYISKYSPEEIYAQHQAWGKLHRHLAIKHDFIPERINPQKKLRIGYVSGDFTHHPVAYFLQPLFANSDRSNFEIFCYANNVKTDAFTNKLKQLAHTWREIHHLNDKQVADLIKEDKIDILVDLAGHNGGNRLLVFAYKPAPIQVTYLGYADTTGLETVDYRFTDAYADPEGKTEHLHTEQLIRLPQGFLCYQPSANSPQPAPPPVITNNYITFGSFNNIAKVSPEIIYYWAEILKQVPNSRLILKYRSLNNQAVRDRIYNLFAQYNITRDRLELKGRIPDKNEHLAFYSQIDIALDTYPYHGTTTTCEALWMGVPVITLAGKVHVSRVGVSLLSAVGLTEFITASPEVYINKAVDLANNINKLTELRKKIRPQMEASPLTDGKAIAQSIELAYRQMWQDWCQEKSEVRSGVIESPSYGVFASAPKKSEVETFHGTSVQNSEVAGNIEQQYVGAQALRPSGEKKGENAYELNNLGVSYIQQGKFEQAILTFKQALAIKPECAEAHNNLGQLYQEQKQFVAAQKHLQQAIKLAPHSPQPYYHLGLLYQAQDKKEQAVKAYRSAIEQDKTYADAYNNLGNVYKKLGQFNLAFAAYEQAIKLQPTKAIYYYNLGNGYQTQRSLTEAIACYQKTIELQPDYASAYNNLAKTYKERGDLEQAILNYRQAVALQPNNGIFHPNLLFSLNYSSSHTPLEIYQEHLNWANNQSVEVITSHYNHPHPDRKLRIGYVSGDLYSHSVSYFFEPLLVNCERRNFTTICYSNNSKTDVTTIKLKQLADSWREIQDLDDKQVIKLIQQDRIDILVDLSGHSKHNRLLVFAAKPAPIQVTYLGYPNTTGLSTIDYRFTDANADPEGATEHLHTEKLIRLPNSFLGYQPPANAPTISPPPVVKNNYITFGSFNNIAKVSPQIIRIWANILKQVPNSRLLLKYKVLDDRSTCDRLYQLFEQEGIEPNRLDLQGWIENISNHLACYHHIDIALDTYPYHGTTTTCEALWMGVPVITLAGEVHVSRVGVSLLSSVGLNEFIADSPEEYISKAVDLAHNIDKLTELRANLRSQIEKSPLTDGKAIAQSIESAYRQMWQEWCNTVGAKGIRPAEEAGDNIISFRGEIKLAQDYCHQGEFEAAIGCLQSILQIKPDNLEAWNLLGNIYRQQDKLILAIEAYQQLVKLQPSNVAALNNLGVLYLQQQESDRAIATFKQVIELAPDYAEAYSNLGQLYGKLNNLDQAQTYLEQAITLKPNFATAYFNLGSIYKNQGKLSAAIVSYQQAAAIEPSADIYSNLASVYKDRGNLAETVNSYQKCLAIEPAHLVAQQNLLFCLHYSSAYSPEQIYHQHQAWGKQYPVGKQNFSLTKPTPDKKLRIGYVSGDFKHHPVAFFLEPILTNCARDNFDIFCYVNNSEIDATTTRLKQLADGWREIHALADKEVSKLIQQDRIDILVDLSGHSGHNRLLVFAHKPAPIQIIYLGYPDTTGLASIDYRLTDNYADPIGKTEHLHTETLIRLPNSFLCYQPPANTPQTSSPPVITNKYITFGSFNNIAKVSPQIIHCWANILKQVPSSRLLLKYKALGDRGTRDRIYNLFAQSGIESNRLDLRGWVEGINNHLAAYSQIDIALDTYPYHGTTTTCEALWMGVPVITLAGKAHVSRVGVSLLSSVGLKEFIAQSPEEYVRKAVDLANNTTKLAELREQLRTQIKSSPLTDGKAIARSIESAYRHVYDDWYKKSHLSQPKVTKNKFKMQKAIFFISTGRCGTQWLATTLSKLYSDLAVVTHEPIKAQYQPNNFFRALDRFEELQNIPAVRQHLHQLENIPPDKLYIETGWTSFAAIPLFINLFKDKIKLVNVVRHPVNMACSMVTHNFYQPEIRNDEFTRLAQLDPYTPGIVQTNYQDIWNQMTPYEKCLFFWNEIHLYAQEIHQNYPEIPYLQIRMEDLLNPQSKTINNLLDFLDLPFRKEIKEQFKHHVDHYQLKTKLNLDWKQVFKHDQTISLTQHFGYDFTQIAKQDLDKRYLSTSTFTPIKLNVFAERIIDNSYSFLVIAFLTEGYKEEGLRLLKSLEQTQLSYCIYQVPSVHQSISLKGKAESLDYTKPNFLASVKNNIDRRNFQSTRKVAFTNILYLDCDMVFIPDNEKINEIQSWCDRGIDFAIYNWLGDKENCTAYTSISRDLKTWMISHGNRMGYHPEYLLCSGCTQFYSLSANSLIIWQTWQKLLKEYSENILSQHNAIFPGDDHFLDYAWNNILKKNTNIKFLWLTKEYARYPWWPWVKPSIDHPNNPSSDYRPFLPNRLPSLAFNRQETSDFIKGNYSEKNITGVSYQILEEVNDKVDSLDNLSLLEVQRIVKHLHRLGKTQLALKISQQALQLEPSNPEFTKLVEMFK